MAQQWCVLCLTVQAILGLQLLLSSLAIWAWGPAPAGLAFTQLFTISFSFLLPLVVTFFLLPVARDANENREYKLSLQRLKYNTEIFQSLLEKQNLSIVPPSNVGIVLGNPQATKKKIKICNPHCGPCSAAHSKLEKLLENNPDIQLRIIFLVVKNETEQTSAPIKHLLAIAEKNSPKLLHDALDDWYLAPKKDYAQFAEKYPMNGELNMQGDKLKAMRLWCSETKIKYTPTIFLSTPSVNMWAKMKDSTNFPTYITLMI